MNTASLIDLLAGYIADAGLTPRVDDTATHVNVFATESVGPFADPAGYAIYSKASGWVRVSTPDGTFEFAIV